MKHYEEQEHYRLQTMHEEIKHLSASLEGLLKRIKVLEDLTQNQTEINESFKEAIELIAEELELAEEGAES